MPQGRRPYRLEFRQRIVELVRAGRSPSELAREFEPSAESINDGGHTYIDIKSTVLASTFR